MPTLILEFLEAIPAFIKALPDLLRITIKLMGLVERLARSKYLRETEEVIDNALAADTVEKKRNAARGFFDLINKL